VAAARVARREARRRLRRLEEEAMEACEGGHSEDGGDDEDEEMPGYEDEEDEGKGEGEHMEEENEEDGSDGEDEGDEDDYASAPKSPSGSGDGGGEEEEDGEGGAGGDLAQLFPHCNGTALFAIGSLMNHSCVPSAQVCYLRGDHGAAVLAKRDLTAGEELTINYVDVAAPVGRRRRQLRHYGFVCDCPKCVEEGGPAGDSSGGAGQ
jgi:hypothetical protein